MLLIELVLFFYTFFSLLSLSVSILKFSLDIPKRQDNDDDDQLDDDNDDDNKTENISDEGIEDNGSDSGTSPNDYLISSVSKTDLDLMSIFNIFEIFFPNI